MCLLNLLGKQPHINVPEKILNSLGKCQCLYKPQREYLHVKWDMQKCPILNVND